jgi:hypothetical protein
MRKLGTKVYVPNGNGKISQIPDEWNSFKTKTLSSYNISNDY